jgi:hypothetical protein
MLNTFLSVAAVFASSPSNPSQGQNATHVESLRRSLGLSPDVKLEWLTSTNGVDTLKLVDDFNRSYIGDTWDYDLRYWEIKDCELVLNANATSEWRYLATFKPIFNHGDRQIISVSYRWGKNADAEGIGEGAHALMLDQPRKDASGYWLWRRTNQERVFLYAIKDGTWEYWPDSSKAYEIAQSHTPLPKAGDVIDAVIRNEPAAVYFDYFINGRWDATLQDTSREFGKNVEWYTGVFIHGQGLNNQVDDFTVKWLQRDAVEPGRVTDLRALDSTKNSVKLEWTMTGDNQLQGKADHLEIRYSTSPITQLNFAAAKLATNLPAPAQPGTKQQFTVTGLQLSTQYYFAMKVYDESDNASLVSNVAKCNTKAESIAQELKLVSGCGQSGVVGQTLANPVLVEVLDQYGLGFKNKSVKFIVTAGRGKVQGKDSASVITGANGRASVSWTMGAAPGLNQIAIRSAVITGSPLQCQANAGTGIPARITLEPSTVAPQPVSTTTALPQLKVTDALGNGVPGLTVQYQLATGGGAFVNGQPPDQKLYTGITNELGVAHASFTTSAAYGDTSKIMIDLPANNALRASLAIIAAAPETLLAVSGNQQSGLGGETLPQPLKVRILDAAGAPAKQYAVTFSVIAGGGTLGNGATQLELKTDAQGFAQTGLKLGTSAGANQVRVVAKFKNAHLENSPFVFTATAVVGRPSATLSTLAVSPISGVPADSVSAATITIALRDEFDAVMPGRTVRLQVSGKENHIEQPILPTDANGETRVKLRSTFAEWKTIKAFILPENLALADSVKIRFLQLAAARMRKAGGDAQTAKVNSRLKDSVVVQLLDKLGNVPKTASVIFSVIAGNGKILGPFVVNSDGRGLARAAWQLGPLPGENKLEARVAGLQGSPLIFTAVAETTSAVEEREDQTLPQAFALYQNSPNPFNPETDIHFELAEAAEITLELFDLNGRAVGKILEAPLAPGKHAVRWNAKDETGRQLDSGVYLYRLRARYGRSQKEFVATKKLTLLK